jgi:hypothetical protein
MLKKWLRNTAILIALAAAAVLAVKIAQPWLVQAPAETPE